MQAASGKAGCDPSPLLLQSYICLLQHHSASQTSLAAIWGFKLAVRKDFLAGLWASETVHSRGQRSISGKLVDMEVRRRLSLSWILKLLLFHVTSLIPRHLSDLHWLLVWVNCSRHGEYENERPVPAAKNSQPSEREESLWLIAV